ncbi:MAG: FG-GAP repeat protein, partial [Roseomonas sp.]|nr:FG-GAP repeat protein [Roseomonas sp.]
MSQSLDPINLADVAGGTGGFVINGRDANDLSGWSVASAGDVNGDGFADLIIGARGGDGAGDAVYNAGESYVVFGKVSGWASPIDLAAIAGGTGGFVIYGQADYDRSGWSVASAGDINGDGFADLIIGAPFADAANNQKSNAGDSYVVFGKALSVTGNAPINLADIAGGTGGFVIFGAVGGNQSGQSVASAGDIDGDGYADLIIGSAYANSSAGASYVIFGKAFAASGNASIDLANIPASVGFVITGRDGNDNSGRSVASAGDVNGDGYADLIIGADRGDGANGDSGDNRGESYVVFGKASGWGTIDLNHVAAGTGGFVINGQTASDRSGRSVASAGDVNGDGFADLIIGAPFNASELGRSYVVFGESNLGAGGTVNLAYVADGTGGFVINGENINYSNGRSGWSVASAGDVNGDGVDDVIIGQPYSNIGAGASYVIFGKANGFSTIDLADIAGGTGGFIINGQGPNDRSGWSVASAGDIDGDGFDDLLVGASGGDGNTNQITDDRGESYVIFGQDFTSTVTHAGTVNDDLLTGTDGVDVMVGGLGNDTLQDGAEDFLNGADALEGGAGNDRLEVSDFTFLRVDGGSGTDTLALNGTALTLDLDLADIADSKLQSIEAIDLGAGGTTLRLTALEVLNLSDSTNTLRVTGGAGASLIFVDSGWVKGSTSGGFVTYTNGLATVLAATSLFPPTVNDDDLSGTNGADTIDALAGNDAVFGDAGNDSLFGNTGNDSLAGGAGDDSLDGGAGDDWASYAGTGAVTVDLGAGSSSGDQGNDRLTSIEAVLGGSGNDLLLAGNVNFAILSGASGADTLVAGGGDNQRLFGGADADSLLGGSGVGRQLFGEAGNDTLVAGGGDYRYLSGGADADSLLGGIGAGQGLFGDAGNDTLVAGGGDYQELYGGEDADSLLGGIGVGQALSGDAGNDTLVAGGGDYQDLLGGADADSLKGGNGFGQELSGEAGNDTLVAGGGDFQYLYGGA